MKTILIFVSTLDGKVTKWGEPHVKFVVISPGPGLL